jgi:hypothetical protein
MKRLTILLVAMMTVLYFNIPAKATSIFINEIHYDNAGSDTNEGVEIAGLAGSDLTGWSVALYNGNGGTLYDTIVLSGVLPNQQSDFGTIFYPVSGIQNGAPDGIALVDSSNVVIQFLSYEGAFTASDGPANGLASIDIGVSESSGTAVGESLQLTGVGYVYEDFTWSGSFGHTYSAINTGQVITSNADTIAVSEPSPVALLGFGLVLLAGFRKMLRRIIAANNDLVSY